MKTTKTLIIDNGTIWLDALKDLAPGEIHIAEPNDSNLFETSQKYDLVILSGSSTTTIRHNSDAFREEVRIIREGTVPIIAICLGFELIATAFGVDLHLIDRGIHDIIDIQTHPDHQDLFGFQDSFKVYESHRWVVSELPLEFQELAWSESGIEMFQHKEHSIYGTQFHPEAYPDKTFGARLFNNILRKLHLLEDLG